MRVESLIKRVQGHEVVMGGVCYAFRPPEWACEVTHPDHVARFAAIREGYRVVPDTLALDFAVPASTPVITASAPKPARRGRSRKPFSEVIPDGDN